MDRRILILLPALLVLLSPAPAAAFCITSYPECGSTPTDNCRVTQDTTFEKGDYYLSRGVNICADNITLDCNNAVLRGSFYYGDGVYFDEVQGSAVKNCLVENYMYGITTYKSPKSTIATSTVSGSSAGIYVLRSPMTVVASSTAFNNGMGFWAQRTNTTLFMNNLATRNSVGFSFDTVNSSALVSNTITQNLYDGIQMDTVFSSQLYSNTLSGNGADGIYVRKSRSNRIYGNLISRNMANGIHLHVSSGNIIQSNIISWNNNSGIELIAKWIGKTENNTIASNRIAANRVGVTIANTKAKNNAFFLNTFFRNLLQATDPSTNTWFSAPGQQGNYWSDYDSPDEGCFDTDGNGVCDSPYNVPGGSNQDLHPLTNSLI